MRYPDQRVVGSSCWLDGQVLTGGYEGRGVFIRTEWLSEGWVSVKRVYLYHANTKFDPESRGLYFRITVNEFG